MSRTFLFAIATTLTLCTLLAARPHGQQPAGDNPCDPRLTPSRTDPLTYSRRGERCEGVYFVPVSGSADLSLVAFTEPVGVFRPGPQERFFLHWAAAPAARSVHVRAVSVKKGVYYRMDVVRPGGSDRLEWPADVVARLNLTSSDLGLTAWVEQAIGGRAQNVYVPLTVATSAAAVSKRQYVALVVPGSEVSELYLSVSAVGGDGRDEKFITRDAPLKGFYPAERPIAVPVSGLPGAGLYRLRLGALLRGGGSTTTTFLFYYPEG